MEKEGKRWDLWARPSEVMALGEHLPVCLYLVLLDWIS